MERVHVPEEVSQEGGSDRYPVERHGFSLHGLLLHLTCRVSEWCQSRRPQKLEVLDR